MAKVKDDVPNIATQSNEPKNENTPQDKTFLEQRAEDDKKAYELLLKLEQAQPMIDDGKGIFRALPKVMSDVGPVGKGGKNKDQGYMFRKLDDVYDAVNPALAKNGVFILPQVMEAQETTMQSKSGGTKLRVKLVVKYTFYHEDGSSLEAIVHGESMDSSDKATNKALSAAYKYMLLQALCITLEGVPDPDLESPQVPQDQPQNNNRQAQRPQAQRQQARPNQGKPQAQQTQRPAAQATKHQGLAGFKIPSGQLKGQELGDIPVDKLSHFLDVYLNYIGQNGLEPEPWVDKYLVPYIAQANPSPNPNPFK